MKNNLLTEKLAYNGESRTKTHVHLLRYTADRFEESLCDDFTRFEPGKDPAEKLWVRVHGLEDAACIQEVCTRFGVDFLAVQDILNVDHPSKVEVFDDYNFLISSIVCHDRTSRVRLVQGSNFVLSFSEGESAFYDGVVEALRNNVLKIRQRTSDYLFSVMINELTANSIAGPLSTATAPATLEPELIPAPDSRDVGARLQNSRRRYMELKRIVLPLKEQYMRMLRSDVGLIREENLPFFNDVNDHLLHVSQLIDSCRETFSSLMDLSAANNDLRMNDIMKRLTIVSTIFIPLTFLAGVWGMNFRYMPELEWRYGYAMAWCVMLAVGVAAYFIFRTKRWR